jgi:hypothetical protein
VAASSRDTAVVSVLGTLADGVVGAFGSTGLVTVDAAGIEIEWWVGADDGWRIPSSGAVHTVRPGVAPAAEGRVRVPGGEVVVRAYAVAGEHAPLVVVDVENASAAPVVLAWVVRAAPGYRIGRVAIEGSTLLVDERARVALPRTPLRWAVETRAVGVHDAVVGGDAASGPFDPAVGARRPGRRGDLEVAVLFPVAHRTRTRIAASTPDGDAVSVARLATLDAVERGWVAALERGMRVELPDEALDAAADAARATLLVGVTTGGKRDRVVAGVACEWGLGEQPHTRARTRGPARDGATDPWPRLRATAAASASLPALAAAWLGTLRGALVRIEGGQIDLLPHFPAEWLGRPVAVHDAPTRFGPVSFALRWHGVRPALLWDAPDGVVVRAPGLDPAWVAVGRAGEALLAEIDATRLLPLGTPTSEAGVIVDDPGSFT